MTDPKFQPGVDCERCGNYVEGDYVTDTDFRRTYNGKDVCVSCLVTLKTENDDYTNR
jgi:hypothetical protein